MESSLAEEVLDADFNDLRLTTRLGRIVEALGERPNLSIPAALGGRAETDAAYRFFANERVTPDAILKCHFEASVRRVAQQPVALLVQDTTEIDLTRPTQQVAGAGPMDSESRRGAFVHPMMAFDSQGLPLGLVWSKMWTRASIQTAATAHEKHQLAKRTPIEEKESIRWIEGLRAARQVAELCPDTECICVGDSESDIYELFAEPRHTTHGRPVQLLVRACQDRALSESNGCLLAAVRATPCRYTCTLNVGPRKPKTSTETRKRRTARDARTAEVEVRTCTVTLRPPPRFDRSLPEVTVNVVLVEEAAPPEGQEPIQWILITTLPIESEAAVELVVAYYCQRWGIETYFKTLKSGCRVEERQFEYLDRELNCLAVYSLAAWRIQMLCRLGRTCPDLDCEVIFEPSEWKSVWMAVHRKSPPNQPPRLNEMIRLIASLGGYVRRKKTQPGTQTLWIGMQRMFDLATAWDVFGPGRTEP